MARRLGGDWLAKYFEGDPATIIRIANGFNFYGAFYVLEESEEKK